MKLFTHWRLVTKFVFLSLVAALLPLLAVFFLSLTKFSEGLRNAAEESLETIVSNLLDLCRISNGADITPLERKLKEIRIGRTGYPYIMDHKGNLIIHPSKQAENIYNSKDSEGRYFIQQMIREALALNSGEIGTIRYPWMNPEEGDSKPREKIVKFCFLPPKKWIVAAGSYEEEIYEKVREAEKILVAGVVVSAFLALSISVFFSRFVTRPLRLLKKAADAMSRKDEPTPVQISSRDEIGALTESFNRMAKRISHHTEELSLAVQQRTQKLEDSERKYRRLSNLLTSIVESSIDGISTTDHKGWITFANTAMCEMTGIQNEELKKKHVSEIYVGGIYKAREIMAALREQGTLMNFEMEMISADGKPFPILLSASLLRDMKGNAIGTVGVFKNISGLKTLEERLRKTHVRLLQAEKMRALGDLLAGVAHEINNPLMASGAILYTLLQDRDLAPTNQKGIMLIQQCNERIRKIVDHLRKFTRDTGTAMETINIASPIEDALLIAGQQLANQGIEICKEIQQGLPPVKGNTGQLEQVFLNLIFNARDAMLESGGRKLLTLSTGLHRLGGNGAEVEVSVVDTGKGIPKENLSKIFEPFFTTKQVGEGTGLGLSICYKIIEDHKGRIEVESEVGKGTRFKVILPAAPQQTETRGEDHGQENSSCGR